MCGVTVCSGTMCGMQSVHVCVQNQGNPGVAQCPTGEHSQSILNALHVWP